MSLTVTHEPDADRYVVHNAAGELQGFIVYDASPMSTTSRPPPTARAISSSTVGAAPPTCPPASTA